MKLFLLMEDGTSREFGSNATGLSIIQAVRHSNVSCIVFGEISKDNTVKWEKQFKPVTVMPSNFGKKK